MRKALVWTHVVSSTLWMSMALALSLITTNALRLSGDAREAAFGMALVIDHQAVQLAATTSAFTGLALSALTPWGFFRHWWVLAKFVITFSQLYLGIFVLSPNLRLDGDPALMRFGSLLMASALACQVWFSTAKPFGRTAWTRPGRRKAAPNRAFALGLAIPVADVLLGTFVLGRTIPVIALLATIGYPIAWLVLRAKRRAALPATKGNPLQT
ncbi:hypothetical protein [Actinosynnema mirum]|uniref:Uncharacterized protein n=1 Tax=Actinosynnema mirum (strain ATCC 29888 / DSM 43827 / JCM 3225 / NBRC 14064 / NCIMB 13271 / NRRL B-12336 / IMRU 3971 / 101) TaxID=446462 RepID=C6WGT1_ACTMD|nr:hypothetical protein [Actinosynnema mirum]ACU35999.1 hypothetical protein Amir_2053 [Actinosynnema mirum DSM 43827]